MSSTTVIHRFVNENGNAIDIEVNSPPPSDNVPRLVCVTMTGPDSTCENIITLKEAQQLQRALHSYLQAAESE
jgi:hypothetical protein